MCCCFLFITGRMLDQFAIPHAMASARVFSPRDAFISTHIGSVIVPFCAL